MKRLVKKVARKALPHRVRAYIRARRSFRYLVKVARAVLARELPPPPPVVITVEVPAPPPPPVVVTVEVQVPAPPPPPDPREPYRAECRRRIAGFRRKPVISVVVPTYDTPLDVLEKAIASVEAQLYPHWELCLVDDCSTDPAVRDYLTRREKRDDRIHVRLRSANGHISAATNDGIKIATGEYVAFLDHDDELTEDALFHVAARLEEKPDTDVVYTDNDKINPDGVACDPFFKPDWSPDYFRGVMYVCHLLVARRSLVLEVGGCDGRFDGIQDYELMLRLSERTDRIEHVAKVLYHWRAVAGSIAADINAKPDIDRLQERAVQEHLDRVGVRARAERQGGHRVLLRPVPKRPRPLISILIPTKDRPELIGQCLKSIYERTTYRPFEVVLGDNETTDPEALAVFDRYPVVRVPIAGGFHFSRFNNLMAAHAHGDYLVLLNNDTEVLDGDWLDALLLYAEQPDVGAVGPRLVFPDSSIQHAGVILGPRGTADHVMRGFPAQSDGYAGSLSCTREASCVTAACLMVRKDKYLAVGGLDEFFVRHYDDVDFCLRLRARGLRNLYAAGATLVHHESKSRGPVYSYTDRVLLLDHWEPAIKAGDPYYNPNFDPLRFDYTLKG
jgi:GT2 family glycosyltransferase